MQFRAGLPLPLLPTKLVAVPEERRPTDDRRQLQRGPSIDDKLSTLRAYRKAQGLCTCCSEKWAPGHRCAPQVQLHVMQEVWNLCESGFVEEECTEVAEDVEATCPPHQLCLMLSSAAMTETPNSRTIQLQGSIAGHPVLILVDSGSTLFLIPQWQQSLKGFNNSAVLSLFALLMVVLSIVLQTYLQLNGLPMGIVFTRHSRFCLWAPLT